MPASASPTASVESDRKRQGRGLIAAAVIVVIAFALNPSFDRHKATIKDATAKRDPVAGFLGAGKLAAWASTYHSIGIASYTEIDRRTVSVGAFGVVLMVGRHDRR